MLNCYPEKRILSEQMLKHPWLKTPASPTYFMQKIFDLGLNNSTTRSKQKDTTSRSKKMRSINTNRSCKTLKQRTTGQILNLMTSSSDMRRWEIFVISIVASWIWAISVMEMEYSWRNQISGQIGNLKLDRYPKILSILPE